MATDIRAELGKRIRKLRVKKGWRQIDLAVESDLSKTHVCDLETGKREVGLEALQRIAKALSETLSELLKGL